MITKGDSGFNVGVHRQGDMIHLADIYSSATGAVGNLSIWLVISQSWVWAPSKAPAVSLSKKLVGSKNRFEHDLHKQNCLFHSQTSNKLVWTKCESKISKS